MKRVARLVIASSIALSTSALALESLDDELLSETIGQDGVTIDITPKVGGLTFSNVIHDGDGIVGATTPGAIVIGNPLSAAGHTVTSIDTQGNPIRILMDATGDVDTVTGGQQPSMQINVSIPAGTIINTGTLSVARSNGGGAAVTNQSAVIMNNLAINLSGAMVLNMTLGNEPATGQMMRLTSTMASGLSLSNVALRDATAVGANGYAIRANSVQVDNAGASTSLDVDVKMDISGSALVATMTTLGTGGMDIRMDGLRVGDTTSTSMGSLSIQGLNMNNAVLRIYGH